MAKLNMQKVSNVDDRNLPIFKEFDAIAEQIRHRAFDLFKIRGFNDGRDFDDWLTAEREICWPKAELVEEDDEFEIKMALAEFDPKEITVTATPREVIVKAAHSDKQKKSSKKDGKKVRWSEFRDSSVYRRIALPAEVDVDKISAEFEHGMLEIEAPKAHEKKDARKKIKVVGH